MKIGRAEIGIMLITLANLPFVGMPLGSLFFYILFWVIRTNFAYVFSSVITGISLILLISDRKGFLKRLKGNKLVAALLMIPSERLFQNQTTKEPQTL
jgi:hypothetical protein